FDGINLTNGYHPLWLLISAVPFKLGFDDLDAARVLLVIQLLVGWGATLALLSATIARVLTRWPPASKKHGPRPGASRVGAIVLGVTLALVAVSPFVVKLFVNGLESGIAATADAAILYLAVRRGGRWLDGSSVGFRLGASGVFALAFLARTDAVILLGCIGLWAIGELVVRRPPAGIRRVIEL